ncbi:hypothetical protein [Shimia sp. SDUM112013]|uniref:hypothetical protein n=1 Tax=Shimia sp. SDUM112013 TaxID=3136160 RepID=UPI0032EB8BDB
MTDSIIRQTKDRWMQEYPDCPQREMALQLLRRGHLEQAHAWIDALDQMRAGGKSALFGKTGT